MSDTSNRSVPLQVLIVGFFLLLTFFSLGVFIYYAYFFFNSLVDGTEFIVFNKGSTYMLGVGLCSGLLTFFLLFEVLNNKVSSSFNKKATHAGIVSIGLIFLLPLIAGFGVNQYVNSIDYVFCADESSRWLHSQTLVYASTEQKCKDWEPL